MPRPIAKDNGAKRALIPIENKRNFLDVDADIIEHVDPVFYGGRKGDVRYIFTYKNRCDIDPICHVKPAQMRLAHCIISS